MLGLPEIVSGKSTGYLNRAIVPVNELSALLAANSLPNPTDGIGIKKVYMFPSEFRRGLLIDSSRSFSETRRNQHVKAGTLNCDEQYRK